MKSNCFINPQRMPYEAPDVSVTRVAVENNFLASQFGVSTLKVDDYELMDEDDKWM